MRDIFIGIPTLTGWLHHQTVDRLLRHWMPAGAYLYVLPNVAPVSWARNEVVDAFLASDREWLWMVDADTVPPPDAPERLLALGTDLASGVTPMRKEGKALIPNVCVSTPQGYVPHYESGPVDVAGGSCLMVRRRVFEALPRPWFRIDTERRDEDFRFCEDAQAHGFTLAADQNVRCLHYREVAL